MKTEKQVVNETKIIKPRHFVALDKDGNREDRALCGYLWDRMYVSHNGAICEKCVELSRKL